MVPRVSDPPTTTIPPSLEALNGDLGKKHVPVVLEQARPLPPQRRSTAPDSPTESTPSPINILTLPSHPRNRSPFTRTHVRSRSSSSSLSAPLMARAHSSPVPDNRNRPSYSITARPSSPLGPPGRHRSPLRKSTDEPFSSFSNQIDIGETISENHELDLTPRVQRKAGGGISIGYPESGTPTSPSPSIHNTFPRTRWRPSSPFHPFISSSTSNPQSYLNPPTSIPLRTSTSSPSLHATQYNEPFPSNSSFSSSSIPSTPTSFRSRSPSISSLETIEDSPDAELEAENIARLKAAADREEAADKDSTEGEEGGMRRRGIGLGRSDKRKRWSVCGAERRGDLDLETIWED